ncbi:hypothetical protein [Pseudomonas mandelii]|uniref:hypothetical protein n=1 Tax=Pseudomonas mandelii TaxID=75612 RepID=UPI00209D6335|nr:hypothetical protein [Pseudomonas mandelii]MCO8312366.1 hypothetical protein [Pseudomonas mandelii]
MSPSTAMTSRAAGDLDSTFNGNGQLVMRFPGARDTTGECIEEGPDGKIYVGGGVDAETDDVIHKLGIACLHKDGTPDTEFGEGGYVVLPFSPMQDTHLRQILFLMVGGEQRILLSGIDTKKGEVVLARLYANGRVDENFGIKGLLTVKPPQSLAKNLGLGFKPSTTVGVNASGPCTVSNGKIHVVMEMYMPTWIANVALLIRLNTDGSFDTDFNKVGYVAVTNQYWGNSSIKDVLVHNGKITVCGTLANKGMVARINDDGSFDTRFGESGFKLIDNTEVSFEKLSHYSESKVVIAGWGLTPRQGVLVGLADNGELDPSFNNGNVLFQSFENENNVLFMSVGITGGKIIVSGRMSTASGQPSIVVARYQLDGKLDLEFGRGKGWSSTKFENHYTVAQNMGLQKDGNILVVGDWGGFSYAALIARFLNTSQ